MPYACNLRFFPVYGSIITPWTIISSPLHPWGFVWHPLSPSASSFPQCLYTLFAMQAVLILYRECKGCNAWEGERGASLWRTEVLSGITYYIKFCQWSNILFYFLVLAPLPCWCQPCKQTYFPHQWIKSSCFSMVFLHKWVKIVVLHSPGQYTIFSVETFKIRILADQKNVYLRLEKSFT